MEQFIVSARKYRPSSFGTLLGQENIARTLKNSILRNQLAHAYLFCGPRGVGKTSAARIFARIINCSAPGEDLEPCGECESCRAFAEGRSYNIHELDAASNNSVDDIRDLVEKVQVPPQVGKYSVYIIDEVHMLSSGAFNAFLKTLEEPPAYAVFILATTEKHKILPTILSRCQTYDFNRITIEDIVRNLRMIASREEVNIDDDAMHVIAQKADGAMRDALTLFDQTVAFCGRDITYEQVIKNLNILDYEYYFNLTDDFLKGDYSTALVRFDEILTRGFNALAFISGLSSHFRNLIVCGNGASKVLLELAPSIVRKYEDYSTKCTPAFLFKALEISSSCEMQYKSSGNQRLLIEFSLMKMASISAQPFAGQTLSSPVASQAAVMPSASSGTSAPSSAETSAKPVQPSRNTGNSGTRRNAGLSIKDMMAKADSSSAETAAPSSEGQSRDSVLDQASLQDAWEALAESEKVRPSLSSAISRAVPELKDGVEVYFRVGNVAQKEWIDRNARLRLEAFLQNRLHCSSLRLFVEVLEIAPNAEKLMYMPSEKVAFLQENSEEFRGLKQDFELETP